MKLSLTIASLCLLLVPAAFAESLCQAPASEVSQCVADAFLPLYPFVSICKDNAGYTLMMDAGAATTPGSSQVERAETDAAVTYTTTDADMDGTKLTFAKSTGAKFKAMLTYKLMGLDTKASYTCTGSLQ